MYRFFWGSVYIFETMLHRVVKDGMSLVISWHTCNDFNATNFRHHGMMANGNLRYKCNELE